MKAEEEYRIYLENRLIFHLKSNSLIENDIYTDLLCRNELERVYISGNKAVAERSCTNNEGLPYTYYQKTDFSNIPPFNTRRVAGNCYITGWEDATLEEFTNFVESHDMTSLYRGKLYKGKSFIKEKK